MQKGQAIQDKLKLDELLELLNDDKKNIYYLALISFNLGLSIKKTVKLNYNDLLEYKDEYKNEVPTQDFWKKIKKYLREPKDKNKYLFPASQQNEENPEHLDARRVVEFIDKKASSLGIDDFGNETLRRTFAYFHYQKFRDIDQTKELLNKISPTATLHYMGYQEDRYICFHCNRGCIYRKKYK